MKKLTTALADMNPPQLYGSAAAKNTLVCWGSTLTTALEAMAVLNKEDKHAANVLHFIDLWPFPVELAQPFLEKAQHLIAVEGNYTAQFANLLKMMTGIEVDKKILKYDGRPISPEYILKCLKE